MAVRAGVDVITHVPRDGVIDAETLAHMAANGQVAVPTLTQMAALAGGRAEAGSYAYSRDSVTALHTARIPILAGTDAFSGPLLPEPVRHGESLHRELALLVEAGLTPPEAQRTAPVLPAWHFALTDRGAVEPGLRADLVLLDGDPLTDITATRRVSRIWCAGIEITPTRTDGDTS